MKDLERSEPIFIVSVNKKLPQQKQTRFTFGSELGVSRIYTDVLAASLVHSYL